MTSLVSVEASNQPTPRVGILPTYVPPDRREGLGRPARRERIEQRLWEMAPGLTVWLILATPLGVGFLITFTNFEYLWLLGLFAVLVDLYWLVKLVHTFRYVLRGIRLLEASQAVDWAARLIQLKRCV